MGTTNAFFVGLSVPLSMCIAFLVMPSLDFTLNMIVLFSFLLALGIVVDDAIVVIENTHRIFHDENIGIVEAAKRACGEVFLPVLSGTLTTLAPFVPLAFMPGVVGKFIYFLPITLIVTLLASLVVAYVFNPVYAVDFMEKEDHHNEKPKMDKGFKVSLIIFASAILIGYVINLGVGNFALTLFAFFLLNKFVLYKWIAAFQTKIWPSIQDKFVGLLGYAVKHPLAILSTTVGIFFLSLFMISVRNGGVSFFPQAEPNFIYTYVELPVGTKISYTDSVTKVLEDRIIKELQKDYPDGKNPLVGSVISNVGKDAGDPNNPDYTPTPHKGRVQVSFVKFSERGGKSTAEYLDKIRAVAKGIPGAKIVVDQEKGGPPTGKPISIEIAGESFDDIIMVADKLKRTIDAANVKGVEELKSDLIKAKPEYILTIDRKKANAEGISTAQIGMALRTALNGSEAIKIKGDKEEYKVMVRLNESQRNSIDQLLNMKLSFMDMTTGRHRQIPLASFIKKEQSETFGGIARKDQKRIIKLESNILKDYDPMEVVAGVQQVIDDYETQLPSNVTVKMGGEQEDQAETTGFLGMAMGISIMLIFGILVLQFNSISKPILILTEIVFSISGVLLGFSIFKMEVSSFMTGIGIVALAGIVVRNGILLVEFADEQMAEGKSVLEAVLNAGRTRMTPVLLTATATILGLIPLAVGLNIDFARWFTEGNPNIFFGGDSVAFWGPLSWTMIFGLAFATFLTLIVVPVMYLLNEHIKARYTALSARYLLPKGFAYIPLFPLILRIVNFLSGNRLVAKETDGKLEYLIVSKKDIQYDA
jgi:multidrug efflux pump subunit AcrB